MMYKIIKVFIFLLMMSASNVSFSANEPLLAKADSAFKKGDDEKSIELYNRLLEEKGFSSEIYSNLASSYYSKGETGKALVSLLKAQKLNPSDKKIKNNITYIRNIVLESNKQELKGKKGDVAPDSSNLIQEFYDSILMNYLPDTWAIWSAVSFILLLGCIATYLFSSVVIIRKVGFFGGIIMLFLTIIFVIFAFSSAAEFKREDHAVIVNSKSVLYKEPMQDSQAASTPLHSGTELKILTEEGAKGEWRKVKLNSSLSGWIKTSDIEVIKL